MIYSNNNLIRFIFAWYLERRYKPKVTNIKIQLFNPVKTIMLDPDVSNRYVTTSALDVLPQELSCRRFHVLQIFRHSLA